MTENIEQLSIELNELALRIRDLKGRVLKAEAASSPEYPALKKELRQLQWQALFILRRWRILKRKADANSKVNFVIKISEIRR